MPGRVLVVGDVMTDILVVPEGSVARGTDRRARIEQQPGGGGANQAVWLAAQGVDAHLAARTGAGDTNRLKAYFEGQGVTAHLGADTARPTGTLVCLIDPDGERSFLTDRGANENLCADDLPPAMLADIDLLHISGYALFGTGPREAVRGLMSNARKMGVPVSVDPASAGFLEEVGAQNFLDWVEGADFIFPNTDEMARLTGETATDAQIAALLTRCGAVVLKRGGLGAMYAARNTAPLDLPAPEVTVLDTTGAGDAFLAGFLAATLAGEDAQACLTRAIATGSRAVQQMGAQPR